MFTTKEMCAFVVVVIVIVQVRDATWDQVSCSRSFVTTEELRCINSRIFAYSSVGFAFCGKV